MKQNLLFNQASALGKRLAMVLTLLLIVGVGQAWGATYTLDQASLTTSKSAYQTSDYTHTATDGSKWVLNGYGIITTSPKHIQLGKASKNYIKTPTCSGNITKVSITFAKACSYYVAIWDMDGNKASSTVANKPVANSTTTFTISGEHKQLQVIATRTTDGTSITTLNAAAYISSITITYETAASYTVTYNANGGSGTMSNSTGSSIEIKECTFTAPECKQFTSWNTAANGSGTSYAPNATVATNLTLYAQWENLPSYTVKLMDNNEVLTSSCNTPISLPNRKGCDGYEFVGWTKSWSVAQTTWTTTAPTIISAGSYTPTANVNLYPVYTKTETTQGTPTTTSKTYTHTITAKTWSANGAQTLNNVSWTLTNDGNYYGYDGTKGQQVGSGSSPAKSMTLTTSGFSSATKITAVRISTSGASSISGSVGVTVGSTAFKSGTATTKSLSSTNTEYEFTGSSSGNVTISWSQTSSKAIYFKAIEVDYQTTTGGGNTTTTYYISVPDCTTETAVYLIPKNSNFWIAYPRRIFGLSSARVLPCRSFAYHSITNSHIKPPPTPILIKRHTFMYGVVTRW